ncbi:MAG: ABC transporter permease [Crocinitomicaceae bacterium]|jgi:sodium transport system permease protein
MIFTIFKKELIDTLRDKRTMRTMLLIPLLVFPITLTLFVNISASFEKKASEEKVNIGIWGDLGKKYENQLKKMPKELGKMELKNFSDSSVLKRAIEQGDIQLGLIIPTNEAELAQTKTSIPLTWLFDATSIGRQERAESYMNYLADIAEKTRLKELGVDAEKLHPLLPVYQNCASHKKMIGQLAGGILPYIFIAFGFIGCMYPAIDLFTGEKERGTIETLLTTPVSRWQILVGKMLVIVTSGMLAASCALLGLFVSIEFLDIVHNKEILDVVHSILTPSFIFAMFSLLFPLVVFFAGAMIPIAVYAKSFKEAQSIITPLNLVMVLPAMVGFFPGIELNAITAAIPVVNIVLSTKELISGTLSIGYYGISLGIMLLLAALSVLVSYRQFGNEARILN